MSNIILNGYGMTLEVHSEKEILYHLTDKANIDNILANGILPSGHGDLEVCGNDGKGVYAIKSLDDMDYVISLAGWLCDIENTLIVQFNTVGNWYVCIDEIVEEDDGCEEDIEFDDCPELKPHYGYVVHPDVVPKENIIQVKSLVEILSERGIKFP